MNTQEKITYLKTKGVTIKLLSILSNITESTLYSFTSGRRNLSIEKKEKINQILDKIINLIQEGE